MDDSEAGPEASPEVPNFVHSRYLHGHACPFWNKRVTVKERVNVEAGFFEGVVPRCAAPGEFFGKELVLLDRDVS